MKNKLKYKILHNKTITIDNKTLYRIQRIEDGLLGGYIEHEGNLSHEGDCFIYNDAIVMDNAKIMDNAIVNDYAMVYGNAIIMGNAIVGNNAIVFGNAIVRGSNIVYKTSTKTDIMPKEINNINNKTDNIIQNKCTCGVGVVGSGMHSDWCDVNN